MTYLLPNSWHLLKAARQEQSDAVTQDQIVQQKIPVQPPKEPDAGLNQTTILTGDQPMAAIGGGIGAVSLLVPVVVGLLGAALFAWMVCCVRKRAQKRRADAASPVNMKHSLLVPERYAPNPQYSSCCGSEVPIIPRDSVRFLDELGEGCFGKVYKGKRLFEPYLFRLNGDKPELDFCGWHRHHLQHHLDFVKRLHLEATYQLGQRGLELIFGQLAPDARPKRPNFRQS
ncbi:hypothetical protein HUJ04_005977 [Dendroctonus ponderosae]|nr:hypothetical protein HUJ04_005977 [Dendroctonus ponderosae]